MKRLLILIMLVVVGCGKSGPPTLDTTNDQSLEASMEAMKNTLAGEERGDFVLCVLTLRSYSEFYNDEKGVIRTRPSDKTKKFHGMTAQQILAEIDLDGKRSK